MFEIIIELDLSEKANIIFTFTWWTLINQQESNSVLKKVFSMAKSYQEPLKSSKGLTFMVKPYQWLIIRISKFLNFCLLKLKCFVCRKFKTSIGSFISFLVICSVMFFFIYRTILLINKGNTTINRKTF